MQNNMQIFHKSFFSKYFFLISGFLLLASSVFLSACQTTETVKKVTVAGSTTILPISEDWASLFYKKNKIIINVQGGGSTTGINLVKEGKVDIGASSRELSDDEKEGLRIIEIGKDALAVVVNNNNPVNNLSIEQVRKVFSGKITNWKELGGPDRSIQVINRESGSGTRRTFEEIVMCNAVKTNKQKNKDCYPMVLSAVVLNSNAEVKKSVELINDSIGYISLGFVDEKIKTLSLDGISPLEEEVLSGHYPVARGLYYLAKADAKTHSKEMKTYIDFVLSNEGQTILGEEGYLPVK